MARAKSFCQGRNQDGSRCRNWAIKGSFYCQKHQRQETAEDRQQMQNYQMYGCLIIIAILVIGFLISSAAGCEDTYLKWLTK